MIVDLRSLATESVTRLQSDICVVGSGPAGLAIVESLRDQPLEVLLLESGGRSPSAVHSLLNRALVEGARMDPLGSRARVFGGASSVWGGRCITLEADDFQTGWPLSFDSLEPWFREARNFCGLPVNPPALPLAEAQPADLGGFSLRWMERQPLRFGPTHLGWIRSSKTVRLLLETTAIDLRMNESGSRVEGLVAVSGNDRRLFIQSRSFVLAMGGLEIPRLLLSSHRDKGPGVGNTLGNVGRFFSDHPYQTTARAEPLPSRTPLVATGLDNHLLLTLSKQTRLAEKVGNCAGYLEPVVGYTQSEAYGSRSVAASRQLRNQFRGRIPPQPLAETLGGLLADLPALGRIGVAKLTEKFSAPQSALLRLVATPEPCAASTVSLADERDKFGVPLPLVNWRPDGAETLAFEVFTRLFHDWWTARYPESALRIFPNPSTDSGNHHMGTTRMHADPAKGVVNSNCRVHQVDNLYAAGSSVFPTFGYANPTLTLVALARRLAHHLKATHLGDS